MDKKGIFSATDLAKYICYKYKEYTGGKEISPIKLQKSLYFLFAYWGAFVRKNRTNEEYVEEKINLSEYLFDEEFEAWVYGPVIKKVFKQFKENNLKYDDNIKKIFDDKQTIVKETIDSLLEEIFSISDFKLVSISHEDKCWQNNFVEEETQHNKIIKGTDIINEYASRKSL